MSGTTLFTLLLALLACSAASARPHLGLRQDASAAAPVFPADPPSCATCEQGFPGIDSCAQAAPVFANVSTVLWNPGAFVDVIRCACTDTFQSTYPQCVDCFTKTNQTQFLNTTDAPAVVSGIRSACALLSTFVGNAPSADGEISSTSSLASTPATSPSPTASTSSGRGLYAPNVALPVTLSFILAALF